MSGYVYRGNNFTVDEPTPKPPRIRKDRPAKPPKPRPQRGHCTTPDCNQPHRARGYCIKHYKQHMRRTQPKPTRPTQTFEERLWAKIRKTPHCWEWTAAMTNSGYPQIARNYRTEYAHRITYELAHGPIPQDQTIVRKCNNQRCVNPAHHQLRHHYTESKVPA